MCFKHHIKQLTPFYCILYSVFPCRPDHPVNSLAGAARVWHTRYTLGLAECYMDVGLCYTLGWVEYYVNDGLCYIQWLAEYYVNVVRVILWGWQSFT